MHNIMALHTILLQYYSIYVWLQYRSPNVVEAHCYVVNSLHTAVRQRSSLSNVRCKLSFNTDATCLLSELLLLQLLRLAELGHHVGHRMVDVLCMREKGGRYRENRLINMLLYIKTTLWKVRTDETCVLSMM